MALFKEQDELLGETLYSNIRVIIYSYLIMILPRLLSELACGYLLLFLMYLVLLIVICTLCIIFHSIVLYYHVVTAFKYLSH